MLWQPVQAELLPDSTIIHGNAGDTALLESEGLTGFDAVVTLTGEEELPFDITDENPFEMEGDPFDFGDEEDPFAGIPEEPVEEDPVAEPAVEPTAEPTEEPAPTAEPVVESNDKEVAMSLIDAPIEDLYAAIGEPATPGEYASSCLIDGEDGVLYYDGFTVYTLRYADGTETVYHVE